MTEAEGMPGPIAVKKRRLRGACDICRTKRVKCDSGNMPGGVCSNCIAFGSKCTHLTGKRAQAKGIYRNLPQGALRLDPIWLAGEKLAGRPPLLNLEEYASTSSKAYTVSSGTTLQGNVQNTLREFSEYIKVLEARLSSKVTNEPEPETEPEMLEMEDDTDTVLAEYMNSMTMSSSRNRFYSKSSNVVLLKTASAVISKAGLRSRPNTKRQQMWEVYPWQIMQELRPPFLMFPEQDLMETLIGLYFEHYNLFQPLLHRPSFEKSLREGLHHQNYYFGATVLVVCALGSKYSDDSRVFLEGTETEQSCGWPFFSQVQPLQGTSLASPPSLYELQYYCLTVMFLHGTSVIETSWAVLGIALRLAQDVGLHRKMAVEPEAIADNESWKRIFWCLVSMDQLASSLFGRPPGLNSDDCDQEYPLEVDDQYWMSGHPEKAFKQPGDRPSTISHFISYLKLVRVLEMTQHTLYAANSSISRKQAVSQLDEALAEWIDSVPAHLRWDPNRKDLVFFRQSACLYTTYYYVKMLVHQPAFVYTESNLAISVESAKRCIDVLEHLSRKAPLAVPKVNAFLFSSAAMLLIDHWKNPSAESEKDLEDVCRCLKLLKRQESRWQLAGKCSDIITGVITYGKQIAAICVQIGNRKRPPQDESWASTSQLLDQTLASRFYKSSLLTPRNLSYSALPSLDLPIDTTSAEIERLLMSTALPDFQAVEHWSQFLDFQE
ncbi:fungal-specific transcription factor domain-containing protein [Mycena floridula]|nr:fungal-specific transcription factor domain-containing protein [Mycena floridula]